MWRYIFRDSGMFLKIIQFLLAFLFFSILASAVILLFFGSGQMENMRFQMMLQRVFLFILPPLLMAFLWYQKPYEKLQLKKLPQFSELVAVAILSVIAVPFVNLLSALNADIVLPESLAGLELWMKNMEELASKLTLQLLNVTDTGLLLQNLMLVAILPAFGEELFFRGSLQNIIASEKNIHAAIWITAFVFSAIHMQFYGFMPRMLLGALYGYLLFWSGSLWLPIVAHLINNGLAVVFYYLKFNSYNVPDIDSLGTGNQWWLAALSGMFSLLIIYFLFANSKKRRCLTEETSSNGR